MDPDTLRELGSVKLPEDVDPKSRRLSWLRRRAGIVAAAFEKSGILPLWRRAARIDGCCRRWATRVDLDTGEIVGRVLERCRDRYCPVCQHLRAHDMRRLVRATIPEIMELWPDVRWIMLTLTQRNVGVEQLGDVMRDMSQAFGRLSRRASWPGLGYWRFAEVTRAGDGTAHPHLHVLIPVRGSYFVDRSEDAQYLDHAEWRDLWRQSLRVEYDPVLDVRVIRPSRKLYARMRGTALDPAELEAAAVCEAVAELAKYPMKFTDTALADPEWLALAALGMRDVRAYSAGGVCRVAAQAGARALEAERELRRADLERRRTALVWWRWTGTDYVRASAGESESWTRERAARAAGALDYAGRLKQVA